MFSSFCENPHGISFRNQDPDEKIILFLRRHFITNLPWLFIAFLLLLIPPFIVLVNLLFSLFFFQNLSLSLILFSFILYHLVIFTVVFVNFITWYYNISLVTNKRIVDIDFSHLVYKNLAETKLSLVQDVSYTQVGTFPALFNYGDGLVQTAGNIDHFDFTAVPQPARVVKIIGGLIGKEKNAH